MKLNGNLHVSGEIISPKIENIDNSSMPTYDVQDAGTIYFNIDTNSMMLNNGISHVHLLTDESSNSVFRESLGTEWLNVDFSFNPANLNNLDNISTLTSSSSLYDVIHQLDSVITSQKITSINDLNDVTITTPSSSDILIYNGSEFVIGDINDIIGSLVFDISDANDTTITSPADGDILEYNVTNSTFENKKKTYTYDTSSSNTIFGIQHNLDSKFCHVTVINKATDNIINDAVVHFGDNNTLQITIPVASPILVIITSVP